MKNKVLTVLFMLSWIGVFLISGSLEQNYISYDNAVVLAAVDYTIMAFSGFKSGLLTVPDYRKGKNVR